MCISWGKDIFQLTTLCCIYSLYFRGRAEAIFGLILLNLWIFSKQLKNFLLLLFFKVFQRMWSWWILLVNWITGSNSSSLSVATLCHRTSQSRPLPMGIALPSPWRWAWPASLIFSFVSWCLTCTWADKQAPGPHIQHFLRFESEFLTLELGMFSASSRSPYIAFPDFWTKFYCLAAIHCCSVSSSQLLRHKTPMFNFSWKHNLFTKYLLCIY